MKASYTPAYRWFNQHAAEVRPPASNWRGAFVALRDGLDANDTARFSEASFGRSVSHNANRMVLIAQHFAAQGAAQEDPRTATLNPMASRSPKAMNDVGWRIWAGNYGTGRMRQLSPNASSIGRWRVGPKDQPYGRFARSFAATEGKTAMGFALGPPALGRAPSGGQGAAWCHLAPRRLVRRRCRRGRRRRRARPHTLKGCRRRRLCALVRRRRRLRSGIPSRPGLVGPVGGEDGHRTRRPIRRGLR